MYRKVDLADFTKLVSLTEDEAQKYSTGCMVPETGCAKSKRRFFETQENCDPCDSQN